MDNGLMIIPTAQMVTMVGLGTLGHCDGIGLTTCSNGSISISEMLALNLD